MKRAIALLLSRPLLAAAGLVAVSALLWFLGPLLAIGEFRPLESELARWIAITASGVLAAAYAATSSARQAQQNRQLLDGLIGTKAAAAPAPGAHDLAVIGKRFEEALALLRSSRLGGRRRLLDALAGRPYLYQLPWYVIIGAPGAGKTTALANSGLEFPLAAKLGKRGIRGIGGTRNCDWWFTGDAVLIDTAGRFTTQDSDQAADQAAWFGFLDLLRKFRPRRPINGVLLTVSVSDLLTATRNEQQDHAQKLRDRIDELTTRLGAGIPIYVLVTKLDLLAGFVEFFADFDKDERAQVWGVTFPYSADAQADPLLRMPSELVALEKRLDERLIDRLQAESDRERRAAVYAFPQQWRVMRETLVELLQAAFSGPQPARRPLVRGIYFTSATQEGTPMDRALGGLARTLGLASRLVPAARQTGRSFFVTRLLREVVFNEAGLAGADPRHRQRRRLFDGAVFATSALALAVALVFAWRAYSGNAGFLATVEERLAALAQDVDKAKKAEPTDLVALLPVLDSAQSLGELPADAASPLAAVLDMGLDQRAKMAAAGQDSYRRLLQEVFLPRVAGRLEARLRSGGKENLETIYESLKAYLMLFSGTNFDRRALSTYLRADWDLTLPSGASAQAGTALRRHFDRLVAGGEVGAPVLAERKLIDETRELVGRVPLAQRAYIRLQSLNLAGVLGSSAREFTIEEVAGPAASQVFARASGAPLSQGVPALYSRPVQPQLPRLGAEVLRQLGAEASWVLGAAAEPVDERSIKRIGAEIEQRYRADYVTRWDEFLLEIRIAPSTTLAQTAQTAQLLSRADSPLAAMLAAAAPQLAPDVWREDDARGGDATQAARRRIEALYKQLAEPSALPQLTGAIGKLSAYLTAVDDAIKRKSAIPSSNVVQELESLSSRWPEPVRSMLRDLASKGAGQSFVARRDELGRQLAGEVGAACSRLLQGRYPLNRSGSDEVSRGEFAKAFGAGGLLDGFFDRHLASFVDTSSRNWTLPTADGGTEAAESLQQFQRAAVIRNALFSDDGRQLGVRLEFRLLEMDPVISSFEIDIDGQLLRFGRDAKGAQAVRWPDTAAREQRVRLGVNTAAAGSGARHSFDGPWGLLRLFERVRVEAGPSADRLLVVFDVEGRRARFEVKSATAPNPLRLAALEQFQCPQRL